MTRRNKKTPELHPFEAFLQGLIDGDHVRVTRIVRHGKKLIGNLLFDDFARDQFENNPVCEGADILLHLKRVLPSFAENNNYGEYVHAINFAKFKQDMPRQHRDSYAEIEARRGDTLAKMLEGVPEVGKWINPPSDEHPENEPGPDTWVGRIAQDNDGHDDGRGNGGGRDDGRGTRKRRGGREF